MSGVASAPRLGPGFALTQPVRRAIGAAGMAGLVVLGGVIAVGGTGGRTFEVPASAKGLPGWIAGPFKPLSVTVTGGQFWLLLAGMFVCYGAVLLAGDALRFRWVAGGVVLLHLIFILSPPLLSKDIFSYLEYARLGVVHHVNPYGHVVKAVPGEQIYRFRWKAQQTAASMVQPCPSAHCSQALR